MNSSKVDHALQYLIAKEEAEKKTPSMMFSLVIWCSLEMPHKYARHVMIPQRRRLLNLPAPGFVKNRNRKEKLAIDGPRELGSRLSERRASRLTARLR